VESRSLRAEVRAWANRTISGYAARVNVRTDIAGINLEELAPGCFARAIREKQNVRALVNHDPSQVLASIRGGSLALAEDGLGLRFTADCAQTVFADALLTSLSRGDIHECSFSFIPRKDKWTKVKDSSGRLRDLRTIEDLDLYDISCVSFPQYDGTSVALVSAASAASAGRMFPSGPPQSMPLELRSRLQAVITTPSAGPDDDETRELRRQAERFLASIR
jgi:HK97 family phage prohead protease